MRFNSKSWRHPMLAVGMFVAFMASGIPAASFGLEATEVPDLDLAAINDAARQAAQGFDCQATDPVPQRLAQLGLVDYSEDPDAGTWQTWFVGPGDVAVPAPPDVASQQTAMELAELQMMALDRTDDQVLEGEQWDNGPAGKPWTELFLELTVVHSDKNAKRNPPFLSRSYAMLETAMFDALAVTWAAKYCYLRPAPYVLNPLLEPTLTQRDVPSYPSEHATVAGVAYVMFRHFFPVEEEPAGHLEEIAEHAAEARLWNGMNFRSDVEAGMAIGKAVAQAVIDARANDGSTDEWTQAEYDARKIEGPCNWKPSAPGYRPTGLVPHWGEVTPFVMASGSQFRAPPPPACDGPEYIAQYRDLYEASKTLTARQAEISDYWEAGQGTVTPPGMSIETAIEKTTEYGLSTMQHARVVAHVAVAVADAAVVAWDSKFTYWFDRPITAIRRLGWDVADGLCVDGIDTHPRNPYGGCWLSHAVTPPFPGYISGHSTFTGAGMQTLKWFFPDDVPEFRAYQTEAAMARYYGGIHFRHDNDQGIESGIKLGNLVASRAAGDGGPGPVTGA